MVKLLPLASDEFEPSVWNVSWGESAWEAINAETCEKRVFTVEECGYAYRDSIFKRPENKKYIITYVTYRLQTAFTPNFSYKALSDRFAGRTGNGLRPAFDAADIRREVVAMRGEKLPNPAVLGNAGSFFMNPVVPETQYRSLAERYPAMPHYERCLPSIRNAA